MTPVRRPKDLAGLGEGLLVLYGDFGIGVCFWNREGLLLEQFYVFLHAPLGAPRQARGTIRLGAEVTPLPWWPAMNERFLRVEWWRRGEPHYHYKYG